MEQVREPKAKAVVLHLSDIHRTPDEPLQTSEILHSLKSDIERYPDDDIPTPNLIVISGDLTQAAESREYEEAMELVSGLCSFLGLTQERVVIVPGNHDIHWPTIEWRIKKQQPHGVIADYILETNGRFQYVESEAAYQERLDNFRHFYQKYFGCSYPSVRAEQYTVYKYPELSVCFVGFNSCDLVDDERFAASIHPDAIAGAADAVARFDGLRIAVWHHDVNWRAERDVKDHLNPDSARTISERCFHLALCGHSHRPASHDTTLLEGLPLPIIAAGSLCAGSRQRPESVPRSYNVLEFHRNGVRVHWRCKLERGTPWLRWSRVRAGSRDLPFLDVPLGASSTSEPDAKPLSTQFAEEISSIGSKHTLSNSRPWCRDEKAQLAQTQAEAESIIYHALPSQHERLFGRACEKNELSQLLKPASHTAGVVVAAVGGMGKTAAAKEVAQTVIGDYKWVVGSTARTRRVVIDPRRSGHRAVAIAGTTGKPVVNIREFFVSIAKQLHVNRADARTEDDLIAEIRARMRGSSALVIFDNLETLPDTQTALTQLASFCEPPRQKILITTRYVPSDLPEDLTRFDLGPIMDDDACSEFVQEELRSTNHLRVDFMEKAVREIVWLSKGHPLVIKLLAGKLVTQGAEAIFAIKSKMGQPTQGEAYYSWLEILYEFIFDNAFLARVGEEGLVVLQLLANLEHGVREDVLLSSSGMKVNQFDTVLDELLRACCILRRHENGSVVLDMHPVTRARFRTLDLDNSSEVTIS